MPDLSMCGGTGQTLIDLGELSTSVSCDWCGTVLSPGRDEDGILFVPAHTPQGDNHVD